MLPKPLTCQGCALETKGRGYVPPSGPPSSKILFVGEAGGEDEARLGAPFVGAAGGLLNRLLGRLGQVRDSYRIDNVCRCQPPSNWFDERAPYYWDASTHCKARHLDTTLAEGHPVVVSLGGTSLKHLLGQHKGTQVKDFHGCVTRDPTDRFWLVPTFHPSHLQRGAMNLFGVVAFDLARAEHVATHGWTLDTPDIIVDPDPEWFAWWVSQVEAAAAQDPGAVWLSVDIETPDKSSGQDEGELTADDRSFTIVRVNFSVHPDEGVSVLYEGPFKALCDRLFRLECVHGLWNKEYDEPRILAAGHQLSGDWLDFMWAWHHLQSDLPRGLGFVAPFYSTFGAWKHLADSHPGYYAAVDGFQTYRVMTGIANDLQSQGMWDVFFRHTHLVHKRALKPAQDMGVKIDRERLVIFVHDLEVKQRRFMHEMQGHVPLEWRPLTPKGGLKHAPKGIAEAAPVHSKGTDKNRDGSDKKDPPDPIKQELYAQVAKLEQHVVPRMGYVCGTCGAEDVNPKHRCAHAKKGANPANVQLRELLLERFFWREPFNPDSPDQILDYMRRRGHKPGRAKKTGADSTDRETLTRLYNTVKDPLYKSILDSRAVGKVKGTYGVGTLKRLDANDRIHPTPTFKPSTHRLSYVNPNITNVITDRGSNELNPDGTPKENLAAGFRACVVADKSDPAWWAAQHKPQAPAIVGCRLFEIDFSGIEALLSGWFMRDPHYMRLAKLGVHAGLASHVLKRPYDSSWADAEIAAYFKQLKKTEEVIYDRSKRVVHGTNYGLTVHGMVKNFPAIFPTLKIATGIRDIYFKMAPGLPAWHNSLRETAYAQNFLGGPGVHPFGYKHWFWAVLGFRQIPYSAYIKRQQRHEPVTIIQGRYYAITLGDDAKRVVAFYPQSTAAGVLKEVMLRLFDPDHPSYVGDAYYGRTPFRAPIHDSLLFEIPFRVWDRTIERVYREMLRPVPELPLAWVPADLRARFGMGDFLSIGVEGKAGADWKHMETLPTPKWADLELGVSQDALFFSHEEGDDAEDEESLGTVA